MFLVIRLLKRKVPHERHFSHFLMLSKADSNHHKQNQNLLCYHYTIGHRLLNAGAKLVNIWQTAKYLLHFSHFSLNYQQIVVLLALLCQKVFAIDEIVGSYWTVLVGELLLIEANTATLYHLAHLTL